MLLPLLHCVSVVRGLGAAIRPGAPAHLCCAHSAHQQGSCTELASGHTAQPLPVRWLFSKVPTPERRRTPNEFELNRGHLIDILRHDYPLLFTKPPDLSLFAPDIVLIDPSGQTRVRGLAQYERVFGMLRFFRRAAMQDAQLTYRIDVDDDSAVSQSCHHS